MQDNYSALELVCYSDKTLASVTVGSKVSLLESLDLSSTKSMWERIQLDVVMQITCCQSRGREQMMALKQLLQGKKIICHLLALNLRYQPRKNRRTPQTRTTSLIFPGTSHLRFQRLAREETGYPSCLLTKF